MELARPGIAVPGRRALGGRILDVVYDEEWTKFGQQVPRFGNIDIIVIIPLLVWPPKVTKNSPRRAGFTHRPAM